VPEILVEDYDTSCTENADCTLVVEGGLCAPCGCGNAALNAGDEQRYVEDTSAAARRCPRSRDDINCGACQESEVLCVSGVCTSRPVVFRSTVGLDTSCQDDPDCFGVATGRACAQCGCDREAVNAQGREAYLERYDDVDCGTPEVQDCAQCPPTEVVCEAGSCMVR